MEKRESIVNPGGGCLPLSNGKLYCIFQFDPREKMVFGILLKDA
jgi:hypothetical protein